MPLRNRNKKKCAPWEAHSWLQLSKPCHLNLHLGHKGPGLGENQEWAQKGRNKSRKRWPHLTAPREQSFHQPSARSLQFGPGLCNHGFTVYMGDLQSTFMFINSFDPHNSGEESRAGHSGLLLPREENKNKLGLQEIVTQPEFDIHPFDPLNHFYCPVQIFLPASK